MDDYYQIEVRPASKNGYFLPAESRGYYGRYDRSGYCVHWWGDGTGADNHDNIVNYMNNQAALGNKSVNYVLSDRKITLSVAPDNVAWCQESGNATEVSVETQPTLGNEGYKRHGWLKAELDSRYNRNLVIHPHKYWFQTACPGTVSLDRIAQETDKWKRGVYTQPPPPLSPPTTPPPAPPPTTADLEWVLFPDGAKDYKCVTQPTNLWNFNQTSWSGFKSPIKQFNQGDVIKDIVGAVTNHTIKATYLVTSYSWGKKITNGINIKDMTLVVQPAPPPVQTPPAPTPPPSQPEWVKNLRDIDDTKYWLKEDVQLTDITTGQPAVPSTILGKDKEFVASALTASKGVEYRITEYSFKGGIYKGVPIDSLTLTPPGVPDINPVPSVEQRLSKLEKLYEAIKAALAKIGINLP